MNNKKVSYFLNAALNYFSSKRCPSCGSNEHSVIDTKYFVTRLIKCNVCNLNYRHPLDSAEFNEHFYNKDYVESDGITTDLPDEIQLKKLLQTNFAGSTKDMSLHIQIIQKLLGHLKGIRIVDYGANWGYVSYQFKQANMIVDSYELAKDRAGYGQKLGLEIKTDENKIVTENQVFYSSHVIEHLPSIPRMINVAKRCLIPNGYFIAFCPNGSKEFRDSNWSKFHKGWGLVHPNYLNADYYQYLFKNNPYFICSDPYDLNDIPELGNRQIIGNLKGWELMVIAKINETIRY